MQKITKYLIYHPNQTIIFSGILLAVIFYLFSLTSTGKLSDLLINLSASMIIITVTVLLVDKLRELNIRSRKQTSRDEAINQIKGANTGIIMTLVLTSIRPIDDYRKDFLKAGEVANDGSISSFSDLQEKYARALLNIDNKTMLKHQKIDKLYLIKSTVESLEKSLVSTLNLYEFAMDIELRTLTVALISKASLFKSSFAITEIDDYRRIIDVDPNFVPAIAAVEYVKAFNDFLDFANLKN